MWKVNRRRTQSDGKSSRCLWQGELKRYSKHCTTKCIAEGVMVFNATFNNISVILWRSVIGGGNRSTQRKPPTCHKSLTKLYEYIRFKHISFTTAYEWNWATGYAYTGSLLFTCTRHTFSKKYITIISII